MNKKQVKINLTQTTQGGTMKEGSKVVNEDKPSETTPRNNTEDKNTKK